MKKILTVLLVLCMMCVTATGCADGENSQPESDLTADTSSPSGVNDYLDNVASSPEDERAAGQGFSAQTSGADVDLTALSSTMVYAEVYNIMANPGDYVGGTIKMSGPYYAVYYEETKQYYHYVIIEDATACCQQGLEFVWKGEHSYPDDYPADNTIIEVAGVFERYEEFGITYYRLVVDDVTVL